MTVCESHLDEVSGSRKEGQAHMVCPGCHTSYEMPEDTIGEEGQTCPECDLPLLRSEENHKRFRCYRCSHRAVVPSGIWCRQFNCPATGEMAKGCRYFVSRGGKKSRR